MSAALAKMNPFPGLRPFAQEEDYLFFGREDQTLDLLQRLGNTRFVAVVGTSGSGKSSLVRCGLLSELLGGKMLEAGASWEIAVTHPGGNPLALLTDALLKADLYDREEEHAGENLLATLSRSHFGLVEAVKQANLGEGTNFLLVVDQFEEIFRFHEAGQRQQEAANEFVSLLLEAAVQKEVPIYVVLTMRSDFIGECGQFEGLAEMVNRGEFLIPRLTRDQYKRVIEGPIKVAGGKITPRLLQRLLNDLGQQADQLPCLQHGLMRTWKVWSERGDAEALDLEDYQQVGRMSQALSLHADEIYDLLANDRQRALCQGMFQALTVEESNSRGIRRPQRLGRLCQVLEVSPGELLPIIDAYRQGGVTFLTPSPEVELTETTIIDISHESLMRVWTRLRQWVEEETQAAGIYHRLSESAALYEQGRAGLYRDPELVIALAWREAKRPNAAWAERYRGGFATAIQFLETSQQASAGEEQAREVARQRELAQAQQLAEARQLRLEQQQRSAVKLRKMLAGLTAVAAIAVGTSIVAGRFWQAANVARLDAERSARLAKNNAELARKNADTAEENEATAVNEAARARTQEAAAQSETYRALLSEVKALRGLHQTGWRDAALADLARLAVMPTPRRDLPELRTEAAASLATPDIQLVATIELSPPDLRSFSFSPDGGTLLTTSRMRGLDFWDVRAHRHLAALECPSSPTNSLYKQVAYLPNGQGLVAATSDQGVVFLDAEGIRTTRAPIAEGPSQPIELTIDADGQRIAISWTDGGGITVHDATSGVRLEKFNDAHFALSPDGRWLARQEGDATMLHLIGSAEPPVVLGHQGGVHTLAFSAGGAMLAGASLDHTTILWDVAQRQQYGILRGHRERVSDVAFSPDGEWIATVGGDYRVRIWDARTTRELATLAGPSWMTHVKWSPDGDHVAARTNSNQVLLYRVTGRHGAQQWLTGHQVELIRVAAHPRQERFATLGYSELITWDVSASRPTPYRFGTEPGAGTAVAYSPDGSLLATASWNSSSREILVRDADTGEIRVQISAPGIPYALTFDAAGKRLASGDTAGNIVVWDLDTRAPLRQFMTNSSTWSMGFLDGDRRLITHGSDSVLLYDLETNEVERRLTLPGRVHRMVVDRARNRLLMAFENGEIGSVSLAGLTPGNRLENAHKGVVESLALSPDGRLLATCGEDHRVVLRDPLTFEPLLDFPEWTGKVMDLAFDSTSRRLAIVGSDSNVDLWNLTALYDGLAAVGLAWDRPTPAAGSTDGSYTSNGRALPPAGVIVILPGNMNPAELDKVRGQVQSGVAAFQQSRFMDAVVELQQANEQLQALRKSRPGDSPLVRQHGICLGFLAASLRDLKRTGEALTRAREGLEVYESLSDPNPVDLYNMACDCAMISALFDDASPDDREKLETRAMEYLRRAIEGDRNGLIPQALVDRDLDPLRGRADFRELILPK